MTHPANKMYDAATKHLTQGQENTDEPVAFLKVEQTLYQATLPVHTF